MPVRLIKNLAQIFFFFFKSRLSHVITIISTPRCSLTKLNWDEHKRRSPLWLVVGGKTAVWEETTSKRKTGRNLAVCHRESEGNAKEASWSRAAARKLACQNPAGKIHMCSASWSLFFFFPEEISDVTCDGQSAWVIVDLKGTDSSSAETLAFEANEANSEELGPVCNLMH